MNFWKKHPLAMAVAIIVTQLLFPVLEVPLRFRVLSVFAIIMFYVVGLMLLDVIHHRAGNRKVARNRHDEHFRWMKKHFQ